MGVHLFPIPFIHFFTCLPKDLRLKSSSDRQGTSFLQVSPSSQLPVPLQSFSLLSKLNLLSCNHIPSFLSYSARSQEEGCSLLHSASFPTQLMHSFSVFFSTWNWHISASQAWTNRCIPYNLSDPFLFLFIGLLLQCAAGLWGELQPLDAFLQDCSRSACSVSPKDQGLSLLNCILFFLCHACSSSRQFQARTLPSASFLLLLVPVYYFFLHPN